jgi:hypothetical protein
VDSAPINGPASAELSEPGRRWSVRTSLARRRAFRAGVGRAVSTIAEAMKIDGEACGSQPWGYTTSSGSANWGS